MIKSSTAWHELGSHSSNMIAMQGPFSKELTREMLLSQNISIMVTKDSGREGGFDEKVAAARELGIKIVVIARPSEIGGLSIKEIEAILARSEEHTAELQSHS